MGNHEWWWYRCATCKELVDGSKSKDADYTLCDKCLPAPSSPTVRREP